MKIQLAVAALSPEIDLRISLACNLLHASQVSIDLRPWDDGVCDVVAINLDEAYGRLVYDIAVRRQLPILAFTRNFGMADVGTIMVPHNAPIATIARKLREIIAQQKPAQDGGHFSGLLAIVLSMNDADEAMVARSGSVEVMLRRPAARIHAKLHSDFYAAETRLIDHSWSISLVPRRVVDEEGWLTSYSLETFLVRACRRHEASLPQLHDRTYRLKIWPDLGGLVDDFDALRMAAALRPSAWSVSALAVHLGITPQRVNGFFVAMLSSGALVEDVPVQSVASPSPHEKPVPSSLVQRIARHFGIGIGPSHAKH